MVGAEGQNVAVTLADVAAFLLTGQLVPTLLSTY